MSKTNHILNKIFLLSNIFPLVIILTQNSFSQKGSEDGSKYGHGSDSIECIKNLSLYREFVRQADYESAYPYWKKVYTECPRASKNIYIDGIKMIRARIENTNDRETKNKYLDTLMLIYEDRIRYFGDVGENRGRQGIDLLRYCDDNQPGFREKAYHLLLESIHSEKGNSPGIVFSNFLSVSLSLYKSSKLDINQSISDYLLVSGIIDSLTAVNSDPDFLKFKDHIDNLFRKDGPVECDSILQFLSNKMKAHAEDVNFLRSSANLLRIKNCTQTALFLDFSKKLYALTPSSESAQNMAILSYNSGKYNEAADYYMKAVELETDNNKKAGIYYNLAVVSSKTGKKQQARDYALNALNLRKNWGEPYILIGQIYADSRDLCSSTILPNAVYWLAVDMFNKARNIDPSIEESANKLIETYTRYFPNKEEAFFANITEGNVYTIGCWINETTKARFNN